MGRRALRKIDPSLDLASWLVAEADLSTDWSAAVLFGREAPLEIEIGTGKGLFLSHATQSRPDHDFLGIEISRKYARFAAAALAKRKIPNGKVLHGDGVRIFREFIPDNSVSAVHVYFPDPWWKKRHKKRRVMNGEFLRDIQRVLCATGSLHFWTDVQEYYETTLALIRTATDLNGPAVPSESTPDHDMDFRTHFERRVRLSGAPVYRAKFHA